MFSTSQEIRSFVHRPDILSQGDPENQYHYFLEWQKVCEPRDLCFQTLYHRHISSTLSGDTYILKADDVESGTFIQWNKTDAYDYFSCWLGVADWSSGYSYVHLFDGSRNISQTSISFSNRIKSVKNYRE